MLKEALSKGVSGKMEAPFLFGLYSDRDLQYLLAGIGICNPS